MKINLEGKEYDFVANGKFMLEYQRTFTDDTFTKAVYRTINERDMLSCAKLVYCGINESIPFEQWLESFESPVFMLEHMLPITEYLTRTINPTIDSKDKKVKKN